MKLLIFTKVLISKTKTYLLLITLVAKFTVKTTNSEFDIYFLSLMSCSTNSQKSHILFTCKNFMFSDFLYVCMRLFYISRQEKTKYIIL